MKIGIATPDGIHLSTNPAPYISPQTIGS